MQLALCMNDCGRFAESLRSYEDALAREALRDDWLKFFGTSDRSGTRPRNASRLDPRPECAWVLLNVSEAQASAICRDR